MILGHGWGGGVVGTGVRLPLTVVFLLLQEVFFGREIEADVGLEESGMRGPDDAVR
jgi:hypothetical protein